MIDPLEQTSEGYRLPLPSREEEQAVLCMARRGWSDKALDPKRAEAAERLKQTSKELSRPLGGKWWKTREELYDA